MKYIDMFKVQTLIVNPPFGWSASLFIFSNYFLVFGWGLTQTRTGNTQCKWVYGVRVHTKCVCFGKWYKNNVNYRISLTTNIYLLNTKDIQTTKKVSLLNLNAYLQVCYIHDIMILHYQNCLSVNYFDDLLKSICIFIQ